ncbi:MAG TPA: DUF1786 domain-containing protein [Anaerolineales bacterium]|nr:DUF1786 domain-containing protein [Anaerolineales bacterium]
MKILAVDIGTGTQDIYLYDSRLDIENGFRLVLPSPTMRVNRAIQEATRRGQPVCLTGLTMGGGPSHWAAESHLKQGYPVYATPEAARSFNDDLTVIREMGIEVVSEEEAGRLPHSVVRLDLADFDFHSITSVFEAFEVPLGDLACVGVAVFDHGAAPPHVSDRMYRFDYLDRRIREVNRLSAFAYRSGEVPSIMTRLQAVVRSASSVDSPLVVMDTAPAAVLGASQERLVSERERVLIANVGNFHTLAFRLGPAGVEGVFEHHTGLLNQEKLDLLLTKLADGTLTREEVYNDNGHGALIYEPNTLPLDGEGWGLAVTGPRRSMMAGSSLRPHFPAPFGDMMMTGCFGILAATADLHPEMAGAIRASLTSDRGNGTPPWEVE